MDQQDRATRLKAMLAQIAPGNNIESVPRPTRDEGSVSALEGLESVGGIDAPVDSGLEKLADDREHDLTPEEMFNLEAIVMPQNRPVVFIEGAAYADVPEPWLSLNAADVKGRIAGILPSIGRIELPLSPLIPFGGTGFVVGEGLLMTNRHVAHLFSQGLGQKIRYQEGGSAIDFKKQVDSPEGDRSAFLKVLGIEMIHPYWDMALLKVDGLPAARPLKLSVTSPENLIGHNIVAIGYPARDDRSDLTLQDRIFDRKYNVKRLQPGTIRPRAEIRSFENKVNAITHDASTLGGNSGSAIVDIDTGEVVALHFGGVYLKANYAVPMFELARDKRVAPLLNFAGTQPPCNDWEPAWQSVAGTETPTPAPAPAPIAKPPVPPVEPSAPTATSVPALASGAHIGAHVATWTIPLHISISIGHPSQSVQPAVGAPATRQTAASESQDAEEGVVVNQDYSTRPGYDPKFLDGITVPLPRLGNSMKPDTAEVRADARKNGDPFELAYYHYSVYMNKRRRTAWFSAANVDGLQRPPIGKREGDRWYRDTRILKSEQLGQEAFEPGIDRGHLTRRDDTAWGADIASATDANNDTFHFTNCALQAAQFNRGKDRWQGLEQFLLEQHAKKDKRRMTVITGPLFGASDPVYKNEKMNYSVRCPLQFWKVCVLIRENGTPSATGFVLGQEEIKDLPGFEETFDVAATQIKIEDLEKRTGLSFGDLKKYDHFAQGGDAGTLERPAGTGGATQSGKLIRQATEIVV